MSINPKDDGRFAANYRIDCLNQYFKIYRKSVEDPETFWGDLAEKNFYWRKKWDKVVTWEPDIPKVEWFINAKLNITENCIDRHLEKNGNDTAILWEPNNPTEPTVKLTYNQLSERVNQFANVLKNQGVKKGDTVGIYLPMIPELAIAMLACARIGAVHSIVFAGYSSCALATRLVDADCALVITADGAYKGEKMIPLKSIVDEALEEAPCVKKVLVAYRTYTNINMKEGRDIYLQDELEKVTSECPAEEMDAEDPLFILYTSGSTGKPKGMIHTTAGYMVYTAYSFINVFNYKEGNVHWCTADIGWITGHSYVIYGPLCNGATTVMYEGISSYPDHGRLWSIAEKHKVNHFYTAPTAIREYAKHSVDYINKYDISSVKSIGSVGEPINEEAWHWCNQNLGDEHSPIVDTYWQTETGGIMISALAYVTPTKPTFASMPLPGIQPCLMYEHGVEIEGNPAEGALCYKYPWPSMARDIHNDHERYKKTYFSKYPGMYYTGDGAFRDEVGYYRITGRTDDVMLYAGQKYGTAPIENIVDEHPAVAESAVIAYKNLSSNTNDLYGFVILKDDCCDRTKDHVRNEINQILFENIGHSLRLEKIQFVEDLPKTRSGKIMRRILRNIANNIDDFGDTSTLLNPEVIDHIKAGVL